MFVQNLSKFVQIGGKLLLGIQGPHHDYEKPITNGMIYSQKIEPLELGFTKHYYLDDKDDRVMAQTIHYRTYSFADAKQLLANYGFVYESRAKTHCHFLEFKRV